MRVVPWQRAVVVGASSGIGAEVARQLAAAGCRVALVARRVDELTRLRDAIGGDAARVYPHDVTCPGTVPALFREVVRDLDGLDLVVYSAGVMPRIAVDEYRFATDDEIVRVNLLGA